MDIKRRLPLWMMRQNPQTEDLTEKRIHSCNSSETKLEDDNIKLIKTRHSRGNRNGKRKSGRDDDDDDDDDEILKEKRKGPGKKKRGVNEKDIQASPRIIDGDDDDDDDLTVEDLMIIAKEYVKAEEMLVEPKESSSTDDLTEEGLMSFDNEVISLKCGKEDIKEFKDVIKSERPTNMSGDPTQDMLDLFLGPLLKNPQKDEEKNLNTITRDTRIEKQSVVVSKEKEVPLMKKKSSLKDKVSMFFD